MCYNRLRNFGKIIVLYTRQREIIKTQNEYARWLRTPKFDKILSLKNCLVELVMLDLHMFLL